MNRKDEDMYDKDWDEEAGAMRFDDDMDTGLAKHCMELDRYRCYGSQTWHLKIRNIMDVFIGTHPNKIG